MEVQVRNLTRSFGAVTAADRVSFTFGSGHVFGFIGPNGAGKTTTIRIMATLDIPQEGDVFYDGVSAVLYPEEVRKAVGYMPDSLPGYRDITVWEYLDFCARSCGLTGRLRLRRLKDVEEFTDLGEMRDKPLAALSKGMKQRVSLARALVHDPEVLIMDEPAAGLDPRARLELRNLLKILASRKKAILLSSHILSELQDICDGAVIIEKGKVLSAGFLREMSRKAEEELSPAGEVKPVSIVLECASRQEEVKLKLLEDPAVAEVRIAPGGKIHFSLREWESSLSPLMARLFGAGFPITGFSKEELSLEELFMRITSGKVQ